MIGKKKGHRDMRAKFSTLAIAVAVGVAVFGLASPAHATFVTYSTIGTFDSGDAAGSNVYLDGAHGIDIVFNGITTNSVTVPPASTASFGTFDTSATTAAALQPVSSGFTLDIFQTSPTSGGPATFVGSLSGKLAIDNSQAFIQFNAPLSGTIANIVYTILSADSNTPGRLDLVPSTTNAGVSTLQGQINVVPEPSAVALLGLGGAVALFFRRRARKINAAA